MANRKNLLFWIGEFEKRLSEMKKMLTGGDYEKLAAKLDALKKTREEMDEKRRDI